MTETFSSSLVIFGVVAIACCASLEHLSIVAVVEISSRRKVELLIEDRGAVFAEHETHNDNRIYIVSSIDSVVVWTAIFSRTPTLQDVRVPFACPSRQYAFYSILKVVGVDVDNGSVVSVIFSGHIRRKRWSKSIFRVYG